MVNRSSNDLIVQMKQAMQFNCQVRARFDTFPTRTNRVSQVNNSISLLEDKLIQRPDILAQVSLFLFIANLSNFLSIE
jgi:hypothetical protein